MKDASWDDCLRNNSAKKVSQDIQRAKSLIETAKDRISLIDEINEKNCNFVFEDYYTSVLEVLQALVISRGYNVLNHVCIGYYLRDVLKREDLFRVFDDIRYKRNSLTYYGSKMDFDTAKSAIDKCKDIFLTCLKLCNSILK
ncbi:hypothetical protein GOV08_03750 [Candidatus Woesearchaeota archaeon]|nr:hypothetical protein [Candidatus Woesearchaeota archaeon]